MNRTSHADLARFMNGNVNFLVLRVTLPLALISNYNFYIMHVSLCSCAGVAVAAGLYGRGEDGLNFAVETV